MKKFLFCTSIFAVLFSGCKENKTLTEPKEEIIDGYAMVTLKPDISNFSENEKIMLGYLFDAAEIMHDIFWQQAYPGDKDELLKGIQNDTLKSLAHINYGPWDRLGGNAPFVDGVGEKPKGANFYPLDMTSEEFDAFQDPNKTSGYTMIRRDSAGKLEAIWYHVYFAEQTEKAAGLIEKAAELAEDEGFKKYLMLRAKALRTDDYFESDLAWMDMKTSRFDFIVGPIENYEDALYGYKSAHESFVLIKDLEWSKKLEKFASLLPALQEGLPCDAKYKQEKPGLDSDMNVYEVALYRGDCNAGGKTIAINLPNDERVHVQKGTRKLQLKNAMKAKFDKILLPIAGIIMTPEQQVNVKFDAFFENVTFHEVAHGMGIKNTIDGKNTVRKALKETYATIEEVKADIMGLYLMDQLRSQGEFEEGDVVENYTTFFAGIFRSIRFGTASAHGKANMLCLNYYQDHGVFTRDENGIYTIDLDKMKIVTAQLLADIMKVQGDGDYEKAKSWIETKSVVNPVLQSDLDRVAAANIPKDIVFNQGKSVIGLK